MTMPPAPLINSDEWQTAYTRDQAHRDSGSRGNRFLGGIILCSLISLTYIYIVYYTTLQEAIKEYQPTTQKIIPYLVFAVIFLLFMSLSILPSMRIASSFFREYYRPPEKAVPSKIINYRLFGKSKLPPPLNLFIQFDYLLIRDGEITPKDSWTAWCAQNLGGPLMLIIFDGNALYLERGNCFSRVVGPGDKVPILEWHETIKYVVDLRPKIKDGTFDVWTKDGISIKLTVQIECRIGDPAQNDPSANLVYPYDPAAIKKAIERYSVRWPKRLEGEPEEFTWIDAAWGQVTGIVPGYIGGRMIDDLLVAKRNGGQILSPSSMQELFERLNNATKSFGVYMIDFQIIKVEMPKEVLEHQTEHWKAEMQSASTINDGEAKAYTIREHEKAKADIQRDLITTIAEGLEKNKDGQFSESMLLSLSNALDESMRDPLTRAYLARETLETLAQIKKMLTLDHLPHKPDENDDI